MQRTSNRRHIRLVIMIGLLLMSLVMLGQQPALAGANGNPGVLPPNSHPHGMSYGEWGAQWWKWIVGIPPEQNPLLDATGAFGAVDQTGQVWFLAGNTGGTTERTLNVPTGKALFFPILNQFWGCPSPEERAYLENAAVTFLGMTPAAAAALSDVALMRLVIGAQVESVTSLSVTIDGMAVADLAGYRAQSPVFTFTDLDFYGATGECGPAVADGYWLMLAPLPVGQHTIHFSGEMVNGPLGDFALDITYHLNVR